MTIGKGMPNKINVLKDIIVIYLHKNNLKKLKKKTFLKTIFLFVFSIATIC